MEEKKIKPSQPLCLAYDTARKEIFEAITFYINKHSIPPFLAETIVSEALGQVKNAAKAERERAQEFYERQLKEYEAEKEGSENE